MLWFFILYFMPFNIGGWWGYMCYKPESLSFIYHLL